MSIFRRRAEFHRVLKKQRTIRRAIYSVVAAIIVSSTTYAVACIYTSTTHAAGPESCFAFSNGTITDYYSNEGNDSSNPVCPRDVVIPDTINGTTVTALGYNAFDSKGLTSVTIPNSVTSIDEYAFSSNKLTSINVPASVTSISYWAFSDNQIESATIANTNATFGGNIFQNDPLSSLAFGASTYSAQTLPATVPDSCFDFSSGSITYYHFADLSLLKNTGTACLYRDLSIPSTINGAAVTSVAGLGSASLTSVTIPSGVTTIADSAFAYNQLTSVSLPSSLTSIGDHAFYNNSLTSVVIPDSVTRIKPLAFSFNKLSSVSLPTGITSIEYDTFNSNQLTSITIPSGVTSIGREAFSTNNLSSITIPAAVTSIDDNAFSYNKLSSATFNNGLTTIGRGAFFYNALTAVTIPSSVTTLGDSAFAYNRIASTTLPSSLTTIGDQVLANNPITTITYGGTTYSTATSPANTPEACFQISGNSVTDYLFADLHLIKDSGIGCLSRAPTIPATIGGVAVTEIGNSALASYQLTSVNIPSSVTSIGAWAFGSNKLSSITIPSSVQNIGRGAFGDNQLTSVTLADGVTNIDSYAFGINKLTDVTIPNSVTTISPTAFFGQNPWGGTVDDSTDPAHNWYSTDPVVLKNVYDNLWYVRLHTADPTNPNHLTDGIANEYYWIGADMNGNGNQNDSLGGHLINPASTTVKYVDTLNRDIAPSTTVTGHLISGADLTDYHASAIDDIPSIDNSDNPTADEQDAIATKLSQFYRVGNTAAFTAPTFNGYTLSAPSSPHQQTLTSDNNNVVFGYTALDGQQSPVIVNPIPSQPTPSAPQPTPSQPAPTTAGSTARKHAAPSHVDAPQSQLEAATVATITPRTTFDFLHDAGSTSQVRATPPLTKSRLTVDATKPCSDIKSANLLPSSSFSAPNKTDTVLGGLSFAIGCSTKGGDTTATITLGEALPTLTDVKVYKLDTSGKPVDVTSQIHLANENSRTVLRYDLRDGQQFDDDHSENGVINDPLYITMPSQTASAPQHAKPPKANQAPWSMGAAGVLIILGGVIIATIAVHKKRRL